MVQEVKMGKLVIQGEMVQLAKLVPRDEMAKMVLLE